jgi:hypothetical protein
MASRVKKWAISGAGIVATIVGAVAGREAVARLFSKPEPDLRSQKVLAEVAAQTNKDLPMTIDKDTELVSSLGLEGVFVYNYRLVNFSAADVDAKQLIAALKPRITTSACTTPDTRDTFLKKGVTLRYSYSDKDRAYVASVDVAPKDCGL